MSGLSCSHEFFRIFHIPVRGKKEMEFQVHGGPAGLELHPPDKVGKITLAGWKVVATALEKFGHNIGELVNDQRPKEKAKKKWHAPDLPLT